MMNLPQARTENLLVRELPAGELMVYDTQSHQAHTLNRAAALVWQQCDGQNEALPVAARLQEELGLPVAVELVTLALSRLQQAHLLIGAVPLPPSSVSRRAMLQKLGLVGGGVALV